MTILIVCFEIVSIVATGCHWLCQCCCTPHGLLRVRTDLAAACTPPWRIGNYASWTTRIRQEDHWRSQWHPNLKTRSLLWLCIMHQATAQIGSQYASRRDFI